MAIFSKKPETTATEAIPAKAADQPVVLTAAHSNGTIVIPRLSEKAALLARVNKYVFKIEGKINKVELRKAIEKSYGVKVASINMVNVKGKYRRYGRTYGRTSNFKKAVVTLAPDSKKLDLIQS